MSAERITYHQVGRPCLGESVSGDATLIKECEGGLLLAIIDGLGHGPAAHQVASRIINWLKSALSVDVDALLKALHLEMRGSIGASIGLAFINFEDFEMRYAGVGNTQAKIMGKRSKTFASRPGNIGTTMRSILLQKEQIVAGDLIVFHTDGIKENFSLSDRPVLHDDSPAAVSADIMRRFGKQHDDASCIVLKLSNG